MSDARRGPLSSGRLRIVVVAAALVMAAVTVGQVAARALERDTIGGAARAIGAPEADATLTDAPAVPALVDGPARPVDGELPKEEGGTHRVFFAVDTWWAVLPSAGSGAHTIWGLASADGPWIDTGTIVDERPFARIDVAWDGEQLVAASTGSRPYRGHALRVHRFSWSAEDRTWSPAPDHPLEVTIDGEPGARMALTPDGTAWLARPRGNGVEVTRTVGRAARWTEWSPLPVDDANVDVGGFDLVVDGDAPVVVWRSLSTNALVVARRGATDAEWTREDVEVPGIMGFGPVDAANGPAGGTLTALVAPTVDNGAAGDQAPSLLLVGLPSPLRAGPPPPPAVVARAADALSDAALVVDGVRARVFALAPPTFPEVDYWYQRNRPAPNAIVEKVATVDDPYVAPGFGRRVMSGVDGSEVTRPYLPATAPADDGLVVVASGPGTATWATLADGTRPPPELPPSASDDAVTVLINDTFDSLPVTGPGPTAWAPEDADPPVGVVVDDPALPARALRLEGGPEPFSSCRPVPELTGAALTFEAIMRAEGQGTSDARLLTVRGSGGSVASVRISSQGLAGWSTGEGRVTGLAVPPGAALRVAVRLDLVARTANISVQTLDEVVLAAVDGLPWLNADTAGEARIDEVCFRPAPGVDTALVVDSLRTTLE